jgi:Spy/CpxP family protein refolding chaperone
MMPVLTLMLICMASGALEAQRTDAQPRRAQLEQQIRERFARAVKMQLGLTDAQIERLSATNQQFDGRRRALVEQERDIRIGMRAELIRGDSADQSRVAKLLDQMISVQRDRLRLLEEEQHELAQFLSPAQRAKFLALQEQVHRSIEEMRQQRGNRSRPSRPGPRRTPPGDRGARIPGGVR